MITFLHVSKDFGGQIVLDDVSFQVNPGERVGIVGPNGAGKTTVFNLITGEIRPDKGEVLTPARLSIGYVRQELNPQSVTASLLDYVANCVPELQAIQAELHAMGETLERGAAADPAATLERMGELQHRFEQLDGYLAVHRAEKALSGLGFAPDSFALPFRSFSGGWQSRAELARILVADPDLLLLDEPSNYLDIPAIEWLEKYLEGFKGTFLLISHDRFFLKSLTSVTIEVAGTKAEKYPGNYEYYSRERALRVRQRLAAQKNQDRKREQLERFVERFRAKNTKATQVQSRLRQMEKMLAIQVPRRIISPGRLRLRPPPRCGVEVVRLDSVGITYDNQRWVLRGIDLHVTRGEKIALIGYNGLGKTTLLRILAGELPPSEGRRVVGGKVVIGYQAQGFADIMDPRASAFGTVRAVAPDSSEEEVRTILGGFGFSGDAVEKHVEVLSGGEKIRLAFARLLVRPPNFLVLDEPTTHLDIQAREALEQALQTYEGTLCLVSHDIDFVRHVATGIIAMTPPGVTRYSGGYDYYHEKMVSVQVSGVSGKPGDRKQGSGVSSRKIETGKKGLEGKRPGEPSSLTPDTRHLPPDKKALRQQRALARQALHEKTKDLKRAIRKAEQEVERLEAEKAVLTQHLAAPNEKTNFGALGQRLKELRHEIAIATSTWEQATEALERVMGESKE